MFHTLSFFFFFFCEKPEVAFCGLGSALPLGRTRRLLVTFNTSRTHKEGERWVQTFMRISVCGAHNSTHSYTHTRECACHFREHPWAVPSANKLLNNNNKQPTPRPTHTRAHAQNLSSSEKSATPHPSHYKTNMTLFIRPSVERTFSRVPQSGVRAHFNRTNRRGSVLPKSPGVVTGF